MHIAAILPAYHNAGCTVLIDAAWSIMQPRREHVTRGEKPLEEPSG